MKHQIFETVLKGQFKVIGEQINQAVAEGAEPQSIIQESLIPAMEEVGCRFEAGKAFVPEMLLAARAMKTALEILKPMLASGSSFSRGTIAIGTVKGDLHDIGKNLVASMLEGVGFTVINLGTDVTADKFVQSVQESNAGIVCMSALLTTTMEYMEEVVKAIDAAGLRDKVKIMVGGAPVNERFAKQIGADGYSDNANAAAELAKKLMAS